MASDFKFGLGIFFFWAFSGFVGGAVAGAAFSEKLNARQLERFEARDKLRAECLVGNENACRLYEVDYQ